MTIKILIVDDSLPMRGVIKKTIKASGYAEAEFFEAENGKLALEILKNTWLDIVITDYNMPEMNGMELIKAMKQDNAFQATPVLVVTTEGSQQKVNEFLEQGAAGYIKKPFTPEAIRNKLIEILGELENAEPENSDDDLDF
ncbi:MAG: response regulator [Desulfobacteraceae bacterium]|nr:MAG: response regulator [Desulfobacteraceae bacterium]